MINKVGEAVGLSSGINTLTNSSFKITGIARLYKVGVGWTIDVSATHGKAPTKRPSGHKN